MTWTESKDVLPALGGIVRQLIWGSAHDGAIFIVQPFDQDWKSTAKLMVDVREAESCEQFWAWVVAERMKVYIIDAETRDVCRYLDT